MNFLAKSKSLQTIKQHTDNLLHTYNIFENIKGKHFDKRQLLLIKLACFYHDVGKANYIFQNIIRNATSKDCSNNDVEYDNNIDRLYKTYNIKQIPHGFFSAMAVSLDHLHNYNNYKDINDYDIRILITTIFNHHTRYYKDNSGERISDIAFKDLLKQDFEPRLNKLSENFTLLDGEVKLASQTFFGNLNKTFIKLDGIDKGYDHNKDTRKWLDYAVVKGALNRIDYYASSKANKEDIDKSNDFEILPVDASKRVKDKIVKKYNAINDCQKFCLESKDYNIVFTASTGYGKTEAALMWLGDSKGFYSLPIKVSINAIYQRILKEGYYTDEGLTLLHSDALNVIMKENNLSHNDALIKYKKIRNLRYPLTICTIDQLIVFVFKPIGAEIILSTLKYSKLIIDEIQSYEPKIIAKILYGIELITKIGGKFCIMTATMPPIIEDYLTKNNIKYKKPAAKFLNKTNRHFIKTIDTDDFDYDNISKLAKHNKVLVICNTIQKAQETYKKLKNLLSDDGINLDLLHSKFIKAHRNEKEEKLLKFSDDINMKGVWISTQIVEASLDIDFDYLFTEMCTADSLLQRMGRCYRKREYKKSTPNIFIYNLPTSKSIYNDALYNLSVEKIKKYDNKIFTEENKQSYIDDCYNMQEIKLKKYYKDINDEINFLKNIAPAVYDKKEAKFKIREIQTLSVLPKVYYDMLTNYNVIDELKKTNDKNKKLKLLDYINNYTISIQANLSSRKIYDVATVDDELEIYVSNKKYDKHIGHTTENEGTFI